MATPILNEYACTTPAAPGRTLYLKHEFPSGALREMREKFPGETRFDVRLHADGLVAEMDYRQALSDGNLFCYDCGANRKQTIREGESSAPNHRPFVRSDGTRMVSEGEVGSLVLNGERWLCDLCTADNRAMVQAEARAAHSWNGYPWVSR